MLRSETEVCFYISRCYGDDGKTNVIGLDNGQRNDCFVQIDERRGSSSGHIRNQEAKIERRHYYGKCR